MASFSSHRRIFWTGKWLQRHDKDAMQFYSPLIFSRGTTLFKHAHFFFNFQAWRLLKAASHMGVDGKENNICHSLNRGKLQMPLITFQDLFPVSQEAESLRSASILFLGIDLQPYPTSECKFSWGYLNFHILTPVSLLLLEVGKGREQFYLKLLGCV